MEMTLTVHVPRRRPLVVDVVVEWAGDQCAADLCRALADHLGEPVPGLTSRGQRVEPDAAVGRPPLVHGASIAVAPAACASRRVVVTPGVLELVVTGGPDAGRSHPLLPPGVSVGRAPDAGLALADDALSRVHAVFEVGPAGVSVRDEGSTNGVSVDGAPITGATPVDAASTIVVGSSSLRLRRVAGRGLPLDQPGDGTLVVRPSTGARPDLGPVEIACPPPPPERHRVRIPWIAALVPVPVGVGLAFVLGPYLLVFALMGPLVLLASALGDRWGSGRSQRLALAAHALDVEVARGRLRLALGDETARLRQAHPDPHTVLTTVEHVLPGLWAGGVDGDGIPLRTGTGAAATRVAWLDGTGRTHPTVEDVPVIIDLAGCRGLAVVGDPETTDGHLRMLIGQLCAVLPPHRLALSVAASGEPWEWVGLLPHSADLADLLSPEGPSPGTARHRVLVVPQAEAVVGGAFALVTRALDAGVHVIVAATERSGVPGGVVTVVTPGPDGRHVLESADSPTGTAVTLDLVGGWWADRVARALAPLRTSDGARGGLPLALSLTQAWGGRDLAPTEVASRWRDRAGRPATPAAVVGVTPDGPFSIDLVHDGPHVLVGGTTGSGKSEFLRTLVTSLATSCPPDELTFVLVDFKGGAAFGACARLPHVVGLVTDLDDHLVARALRSLGAELRRRERIFAAVGASDLEGYRRNQPSGAESVPRLVVVVDELKALVDEVPDFVSGLVRLAALGRSLGIHLVLATQRPAGAVTAEIQANVNLRIAFRVRDRADSVDILEDAAAAGIRSSTPGRALCRGGEGSLVTFQAATVSDAVADPAPHLTLHQPGPRPLTATSSDAGAAGAAGAAAGAEVGVAPIIEAVCRAHRLLGGPEPRPPWLPPLPSLLPHVAPTPLPETDRAIGAVVGVLDEPELQRIS
ncbi:MAG TPA: FtsK/SpoIIIE domain-containing protein, partial [Ornithinibacter sp.]|nr:FtsK/SpoIIIE domain-containing protein [Ornithinibacter sp.]